MLNIFQYTISASCTGKTSIAQLLRTDLDGINSTPNGNGISQAHKYEVEVFGHDNYYRVRSGYVLYSSFLFLFVAFYKK